MKSVLVEDEEGVFRRMVIDLPDYSRWGELFTCIEILLVQCVFENIPFLVGTISDQIIIEGSEFDVLLWEGDSVLGFELFEVDFILIKAGYAEGSWVAFSS